MIPLAVVYDTSTGDVWLPSNVPTSEGGEPTLLVSLNPPLTNAQLTSYGFSGFGSTNTDPSGATASTSIGIGGFPGTIQRTQSFFDLLLSGSSLSSALKRFVAGGASAVALGSGPIQTGGGGGGSAGAAAQNSPVANPNQANPSNPTPVTNPAQISAPAPAPALAPVGSGGFNIGAAAQASVETIGQAAGAAGGAVVGAVQAGGGAVAGALSQAGSTVGGALQTAGNAISSALGRIGL
jgi:hypothetical protein